ncbi:MAG: hypothetical protein HY554_08600 [Elusimicrobia bacterium]|nr:hypothetical protein [Elusimicrobiota bacterium]
MKKSPARGRPERSVLLRPARKPSPDKAFYEQLHAAYSALCAALFNFAPLSGHPGGSLSAGRIAEALLFSTLDYDYADPRRPDADLVSFAAGHKALGLYALWALRNELARLAHPEAMPHEELQLRLEDLLGFRKNPAHGTPLFRQLRVKPLDGHPTPAVPFVPVATGASGVGIGTGVGLAVAALDAYGPAGPRVHLIEGEGGMTPGRVHEALSAASTLGLGNLFLHLDWNQASIDSERVCGEGGRGGDYVPWSPSDLLRTHDWNVVEAGDGRDVERVLAAQRAALGLGNGKPTAIVYRTIKGEGYGIEGRASHGGGHPFCSDGYVRALGRFEAAFKVRLPRCRADRDPETVERSFYETLLAMRDALAAKPRLVAQAAGKLRAAKDRLAARELAPREGAPRLERLYAEPPSPTQPPPELAWEAGKPVAIRAAMGKTLGALNRLTEGAFLVSAADLLDSTSVSGANAGFAPGFHHPRRNPASRLVPAGGICEDAMGAMMAGVSSYGRHIGVTSSYAAFIAPLQHIAARLHGIGQQAGGGPRRTWIMVNAHAGPMTGEDGPTHADPQALQLLQGNFPPGTLITLTPWDPAEVWPLALAGLRARPAVLAPFVTRPALPAPDRAKLRLPPAAEAIQGVYAWRRAQTQATVVLQGAGVAALFARDVLARLDAEGVRVNVFYVASAELFDLCSPMERESAFPETLASHAIGISDFTLPTLHRWVRCEEGLRRSLHPFAHGRFLGSGGWESVLEEGGLSGAAQFEAVRAWAKLIG